MNKPTISLCGPGLYCFTGWVAGKLVQYIILKTAEGWTLTKVYGESAHFYAAFATKRDAINALTA